MADTLSDHEELRKRTNLSSLLFLCECYFINNLIEDLSSKKVPYAIPQNAFS